MPSPTEAPGVMLARGVARGLSERGFLALPEFPTIDGRRMDLCALGPKGEIWCVEVKSSRADFMSDAKWPDYVAWCDRFFFAVPESFPVELLPDGHGLILADHWSAEIVRMPSHEPMAPARRKAVTLRFARCAAERLMRGVLA